MDMKTTEIYSFEKDGAAYLNALDTCQIIEIDGDTFCYFLEVLPTKRIPKGYTLPARIKSAFGFAEGCEEISVFWITEDGRFFCQKTNVINRD